MFGLIDCETFYASAECVFNPQFRGKPLMVLSNNDGTVVAMNAAAKSLGFSKFKPFFEIEREARKQNVIVTSSNYELYGNLSSRVFDVISSLTPEIEVYSIDECWVNTDGFQTDHRKLGREIVDRVYREIRIPVRAGFGPNKTLAKVASTIAKKVKRANCVCVIDSMVQREKILRAFPVAEVWGIGRQLRAHMLSDGIETAWDLATFDKKQLRRKYSVNVERTARELDDERCMAFHENVAETQQIIVSRSFGKKVNSVSDLIGLTTGYLELATSKLRKKDLLTKAVSITVIGAYGDPKAHRFNAVILLETPTNSSVELAELVVSAIKDKARNNARYAKSLVTLFDISEENTHQLDMLSKEQSNKSKQLMKSIDQINSKGGNCIHLARSMLGKDSRMKRLKKTPNYLGCWDDIPIAKC